MLSNFLNTFCANVKWKPIVPGWYVSSTSSSPSHPNLSIVLNPRSRHIPRSYFLTHVNFVRENPVIDLKDECVFLKRLQFLRVRDSNRLVLLALARHCLSRSQTRQRPVGSGRSHKNRRFRNVQGGHHRRQDNQNLLRHTRLHSARGKKYASVVLFKSISSYWFKQVVLAKMRILCSTTPVSIYPPCPLAYFEIKFNLKLGKEKNLNFTRLSSTVMWEGRFLFIFLLLRLFCINLTVSPWIGGLTVYCCTRC